MVLQRAQLICLTLCVPIALGWTQMGRLLLALGQEPRMVAVAARYLRLLTPALFVSVFTDTTRRYLLAQVGARGCGRRSGCCFGCSCCCAEG